MSLQFFWQDEPNGNLDFDQLMGDHEADLKPIGENAVQIAGITREDCQEMKNTLRVITMKKRSAANRSNKVQVEV